MQFLGREAVVQRITQLNKTGYEQTDRFSLTGRRSLFVDSVDSGTLACLLLGGIRSGMV